MSVIMFDFDGTIADSFDYVFGFLAAEAGQTKDFSEADLATFSGLSMKDMALKLGIPLWRLPFVYFKGRRVMRSHIHTLPPFPGMIDVIKQLHEDGHTLAIISSNSVRNIKKFLRQHELQDHFRTIRGGAGIFGKVRLIRRVRNRFQSDDNWYIGDEVADVVSAKAAGVQVIAVEWGFAGTDDLQKLEPTALVSSAAEILTVIESA